MVSGGEIEEPNPSSWVKLARRAFLFVTAGLLFFLALYHLFAPQLAGSELLKAIGGIAVAFLAVPLGAAFRTKATTPPAPIARRILLAGIALMILGAILSWFEQKYAVTLLAAGIAWVAVALLLRTRVLVF